MIEVDPKEIFEKPKNAKERKNEYKSVKNFRVKKNKMITDFDSIALFAKFQNFCLTNKDQK